MACHSPWRSNAIRRDNMRTSSGIAWPQASSSDALTSCHVDTKSSKGSAGFVAVIAWMTSSKALGRKEKDTSFRTSIARRQPPTARAPLINFGTDPRAKTQNGTTRHKDDHNATQNDKSGPTEHCPFSRQVRCCGGPIHVYIHLRSLYDGVT